MTDFLNKAKDKAGELMTSGMDKARELTPDASDIKRTADALVDGASKVVEEATQLGKDALKSDMARDAAAGAAIGAVIAVPVPLIGPVAGAVVGASLGVYKSIRHGSNRGSAAEPDSPPASQNTEAASRDVPALDRYEELNKLHELKVKGVLTDEEFATEKQKVLDR